MKYKFNYKTSALDIWKLSMYGTYGSIVGVVNIIFTVAMVLLAVRFWTAVSNLLRMLIVVGIGLFTIIQPIMVYLKAKTVEKTLPNDMEISFDDYGVWTKTPNEEASLKWNKIKGVIKKPSMVIIFTTGKHGFLITNKMLGEEKEDFYNYVVSKIKK